MLFHFFLGDPSHTYPWFGIFDFASVDDPDYLGLTGTRFSSSRCNGLVSHFSLLFFISL